MRVCFSTLRTFCALLLLGFALPAWSQEPAPTPKPKSPLQRLFFPTDQDAFVPITSLEWGAPDRWSFTSRYIHIFDKDRDHTRLLHNFTLTLSPGTAGGRLGAGYLNVYNTGKGGPASGKKNGITLLSEARAVLVRTWGKSLMTDANRKFAGVELRTSLAGIINLGVGYYSPIGAPPGDRKSFFGLHAGVGM